MELVLTRALTFPLDDTCANGEVPPPAKDSFLYEAFDANKIEVQKVLDSPYIQSIKKGELNPKYYGAFTVLDSYYCYRAEESICRLLDRVNPQLFPRLYEVAYTRYCKYKKYNKTFKYDWHIKDSNSVDPTQTMMNYADYEMMIARTKLPIYALVAFLPCYYLWPWFSKKISEEDKDYNPGPYIYWFKSVYSSDDNFSGAWEIANLIDEWKTDPKKFDKSIAMPIFAQSMQYEAQIFNEAFRKFAKG